MYIKNTEGNLTLPVLLGYNTYNSSNNMDDTIYYVSRKSAGRDGSIKLNHDRMRISGTNRGEDETLGVDIFLAT